MRVSKVKILVGIVINLLRDLTTSSELERRLSIAMCLLLYKIQEGYAIFWR